MAWTRGADGSYTLANSGERRAVVFADAAATNYAVRAQIRTTLDEVRVLVLCSPDGRSGVEAGILGSNWVIREIDFGTVGASIASGAHGLAAGQPLTVEVRVQQSGAGVSVAIHANGSAAAALTGVYTGSAYARYAGYGFASLVNGAVVQSFEVCELTERTETVEQFLVIVAGGSVYLALSDTELVTIAERGVSAQGDVCMVEYYGKVYIADGQAPRVLDPVARTLTAWAGAAADARLAVARMGRVGVVTAANPYELTFSRADDPTNYTAGLEASDAYSLSVLIGSKLGQPIVSLTNAHANTLVIGTPRGWYRLNGDPLLGLPTLDVITGANYGPAGPNAVAETSLADGSPAIVALTAEGLVVIPAGGSIIKISEPVLTTFLALPPEELGGYHISVCRDPARRLLMVFVTPRDDREATHIAYSERQGGYQRGGPGFYPIRLPNRVGPTCAVEWRGRAVLGTKDGYVVDMHDPDVTDDMGEPRSAYCMLSLLSDLPDTDVLVTRVEHALTSESDTVKLKIWGGPSAEAAYDPARRAYLFNANLRPFSAPVIATVRSPAIVIEILTEGGTVGFEQLAVDVSQARAATRAARRAAEVAPLPCAVPPAGVQDAGSGSLISGPAGSGSGTFADVAFLSGFTPGPSTPSGTAHDWNDL